MVTAYVVSAIGIPVFLHYCGGELENVNYVLKGTTCCGEEEDSKPMDDGCCKDEKLVIKNTTDFTLKQINNDLVKSAEKIFSSQPTLSIIGSPSSDLSTNFIARSLSK